MARNYTQLRSESAAEAASLSDLQVGAGRDDNVVKHSFAVLSLDRRCLADALASMFA